MQKKPKSKSANHAAELGLGKKVKELRIAHNLTQEQVARALNVTPGYVSNVENERISMSLRLLIYYARLTDSTLDSLVGSIDGDYQKTALDNEILTLVSKMDDQQKRNLIRTLRIWLLE